MAWALAGPLMRSGSRAAQCCRSSQLAIGAPDRAHGKARFGTPAWGAAGNEPDKGVNHHTLKILAETQVERGIHHSCAPTQLPTTGEKGAWRKRSLAERLCSDLRHHFARL